MALGTDADLQITVIDIGLQLEPERARLAASLAAQPPAEWDLGAVGDIAAQPVATEGGGLPQKRSYGSDFAFRDVGQLTGLSAADDVNAAVISAAYGGYSNVWGAQVMPFAASVLEQWPVTYSQLVPHYTRILERIPFIAEEDDLATLFPLLAPAAPLPHVSRRTEWVLAAYDRHRARLRRRGLTLGRARLAVDGARCMGVGLCLTGCPYSLIYSAAQTLDELRRSGRITYRRGLTALSVSEEGSIATVRARDSAGVIHRFDADRIYIACGAVSSTRLALTSLGRFDQEVEMLESRQFTLPFLSVRPTPDLQAEGRFTLNQFNMTVDADDRGYDLSQLHFYTYNPAFEDALPRPLRATSAAGLRRQLLRRLCVALGYLPSWRSPRIRLRAYPPGSPGALAALDISSGPAPAEGRAMLRTIMKEVTFAAPLLDLYPLLPFLSTSAPAKSYHVGGSFPHASKGTSIFSSDRLGRVGGWRRIHLVDAAVFPSIPATTFTLTVMANAHRIASETKTLEG